jgi:hypothetical protein
MADEINIIEGTIEVNKILPDSTPINLSQIEGWNDLPEDQRSFLSHYFDYFPNDSLSCIRSSTPLHNLKTWKKNVEFKDVYDFIHSLHADSLAAAHYKEAVGNSKIRGQVLKSLKAKGYEPENKTNTTNVLNIGASSMSDVLKQLKS